MKTPTRLGRLRLLVDVLAASDLDRSTRRFVIERVAEAGWLGSRSRPGRPSPAAELVKEAGERYLSGDTSREIAASFGCTDNSARHMIRLYLQTLGTTPAAVKARRDREAKERALYEQLLGRMTHPRRCQACPAWVLRGDFKTCSSECAKAIRTSSRRYWLNPDLRERHRVQQARTVLRRPEKYKPSHIEWAKRMLSDNPPPPNRTWIAPQNRELAKTLGVEQVGHDAPRLVPCSATNADGSTCRRRVPEGQGVCHIHGSARRAG